MSKFFRFRKIFLLVLIIWLAIFLRLWRLGENPPGIHADEALTGYTAYSLLTTGKDLGGHGVSFMLTDTIIGGTFPGVYSIILVPFVHYFGLSVAIDRLPSALLGVGSVGAFFFILKYFFRSSPIPYIGSFLLAINPWSIHISRQGLLESIALFSVMTATALFFYAQRLPLFVASAFMFGISLFTYDAPKIFVLPFVILLFAMRFKELSKRKMATSAFLVIFISFQMLSFWQLFFREEIGEYSRSSVLNMENIEKAVNTERRLTNAPLWLSSIFHNKVTVGFNNFLNSYVSIFSLNWFFVNGDGSLQQSVARHGQFYLFEMPLFFMGLYYLFQRKVKIAIFLLGWLLLGALPGGLSRGSYPYRSVMLLPIPIVFSSVGLMYLWRLVDPFHKVIVNAGKASVLFLATIYISSYFFTYFFDYPVYASEQWGKQRVEALQYVINHSSDYDHVFIDGGGAWYTTYAFMQKMHPADFRKALGEQSVFEGKVKNIDIVKIGKLHFGNFDIDADEEVYPYTYFPDKSLIVVHGRKFPLVEEKVGYVDPDGIRVVFAIYEVSETP